MWKLYVALWSIRGFYGYKFDVRLFSYTRCSMLVLIFNLILLVFQNLTAPFSPRHLSSWHFLSDSSPGRGLTRCNFSLLQMAYFLRCSVYNTGFLVLRSISTRQSSTSFTALKIFLGILHFRHEKFIFRQFFLMTAVHITQRLIFTVSIG